MTYGATEKQWRHFAHTLGLTEHLLPCVANPNAVIAQRSTLRSLGKTPSIYDRYGEVVGLGDWTSRTASSDDIARWSREKDYGICIQARAIRAIDIDVPDQATADLIEQAVSTALAGLVLPKRYRTNSGKRLLAFRFESPMPKRVVPVDGGIVEFLGDGQQFIAAGMHDSGVPYLWDADYTVIPTLTEEEFNAVWSMLVTLFATGEPRIARTKERGPRPDIGPTTDDLGKWLIDKWDVYDTGHQGELYLRCPFGDEHTTDSNETATAYFLAGTGGYERGHWVCLHGHCAGRPDHDFMERCGYIGSGFAAMPDEPRAAPTYADPPLITVAPCGRTTVELALIDQPADRMPPLVRDSGGKIEATADNLQKMVGRPDIVMMHIAYDSFRDEIVWLPWGSDPERAAWIPFSDADYVRLEIMLERRNVKPIGKERLRGSVNFVAQMHTIDSALLWLASLKWDGTPRVSRFLADYLGAHATPYNDAISRYWWTALAGRIMQPGVQADMAPILYGAQGQRKTSAIKAMVPGTDNYAEIDLTERDDNLSRKLRGKMIGELEELRGLRSRDSEAIKAWLTRTQEEWTPKFREFNTKFLRRLLFVGTTNMAEFLADATGERRWLPTDTGVTGPIRVDAIARDRDQLWAEARILFAMDGVDYADAERLAKLEHHRYKDIDPWENPVAEWLVSASLDGSAPRDKLMNCVGLTVSDIATGALGVSARQVNYEVKNRVARVMTSLGYRQRSARWYG